MDKVKTTTLEIPVTLKLIVPADLNEAQQASIVQDIQSMDNVPTIGSGVMEQALKQYMRQEDDWSPKQIMGAELWVNADRFEETGS